MPQDMTAEEIAEILAFAPGRGTVETRPFYTDEQLANAGASRRSEGRDRNADFRTALGDGSWI